MEEALDLFRSAGKSVLTSEDAATRSKSRDAHGRSSREGHVPCVTVRDLDGMTITAGHEPD